MTRNAMNSSVYRFTTTMMVGGMILALAFHPARADTVGDELVTMAGQAVVEQGRNAMQNIGKDLMAELQQGATIRESLRTAVVEPDVALPANESSDEPQIAGR